MIARCRLVFATVLLASSALHLTAMTLIWTVPPVQMEGGAQVAESSLGSSFADLSQGVQQPTQTVQKVAQPAKPAVMRAIKAEAAMTSRAPSQTPEKPVAPKTSPTEPPPHTNAVVPDTVVAALPEVSAATPVSIRPRMPAKRPDLPKAEPAPKRANQAPKPVQPRGNANRNAKAGTQNGAAAKSAQPRQASKANTQKTKGNAAASNYPGEVMRRISRVSRPRTSARGIAVIRFTIAQNGGLASANVARSSGSAALDRAALAVVQKAQPFPRPPSGARRSYSIKIKGR